MKRSERGLRKKIADREQKDSADTAGGDERNLATPTVVWGEPDPEHRPEGMVYDPEDGTLRFDAWSAQVVIL